MGSAGTCGGGPRRSPASRLARPPAGLPAGLTSSTRTPPLTAGPARLRTSLFARPGCLRVGSGPRGQLEACRLVPCAQLLCCLLERPCSACAGNTLGREPTPARPLTRAASRFASATTSLRECPGLHLQKGPMPLLPPVSFRARASPAGRHAPPRRRRGSHVLWQAARASGDAPWTVGAGALRRAAARSMQPRGLRLLVRGLPGRALSALIQSPCSRACCTHRTCSSICTRPPRPHEACGRIPPCRCCCLVISASR